MRNGVPCLPWRPVPLCRPSPNDRWMGAFYAMAYIAGNPDHSHDFVTGNRHIHPRLAPYAYSGIVCTQMSTKKNVRPMPHAQDAPKCSLHYEKQTNVLFQSSPILSAIVSNCLQTFSMSSTAFNVLITRILSPRRLPSPLMHSWSCHLCMAPLCAAPLARLYMVNLMSDNCHDRRKMNW